MNFFAGQVPGADKLYALNYANTYVPTLTAVTTNPNLGADGVTSGAYHRNGLLVTGWARFRWDGTGVSAGSGTLEISLPLEADASVMDITTNTGESFTVGIGFVNSNTNGGAIVYTRITSVSPSVVRMMLDGVATSLAASHFAGTAGEEITVNFAYVADPAALPFGT